MVGHNITIFPRLYNQFFSRSKSMYSLGSLSLFLSCNAIFYFVSIGSKTYDWKQRMECISLISETNIKKADQSWCFFPFYLYLLIVRNIYLLIFFLLISLFQIALVFFLLPLFLSSFIFFIGRSVSLPERHECISLLFK